ncbi:hypothetical protein C0J52_24248 [Blattella germanica]|nr:hypothetical protein C0J52_24248 [Blattella germanica]
MYKNKKYLLLKKTIKDHKEILNVLQHNIKITIATRAICTCKYLQISLLVLFL